jgi:hypothetical protein
MASPLEALVEEYRLSASQARERLEMLSRALEAAEALEALAQLAPRDRGGRISAELARARVALSEGDAAVVLQALEAACRDLAGSAASAVASSRLEARACPPARRVKLLKAMLDASGPLSLITTSLLSSGATTADELYSNAEKLAALWQRLAKLLVELYNTARRLERRGYCKWTDPLLVAARLSRGEDVDDALSRLEQAVTRLAEIAEMAEELAEGVGETAEALEECRRLEGDSPACRWLAGLLEKLMDARESLRRIALVESVEQLGRLYEKTAGARGELEAARRLAGKLLERLGARGTGEPLRELVRALARARSELGFQGVEEELMIMLGERDRIDLIELAEKGAEYITAILNLCKHGIAVCEAKMY